MRADPAAPALAVPDPGDATTASAVSRLRWQLRAKPDVVILALGGNDGLRGLELSQTEKHLDEAITLAIGPEGGFTEDERQVALANQWTPISLGQRILRIETAAVALVAAVRSPATPVSSAVNMS